MSAYSSVGIGERLHKPLGRKFNKMTLYFPTINVNALLRISVKAMIDTVGGNRLVLSRLVFGILLHLPTILYRFSNTKRKN